MHLVDTTWPPLTYSGWSTERACAQNRSIHGSEKRSGKNGTDMANQNSKKCAHIPCLCDVAAGEESCGQACRDAGSEDVEIACECGHPGCPLTFRQFASGSAANLVS